MAHSSLLGIDDVPTAAPGHDVEALGPSDTSDTGSDVAGLADQDELDPDLPVDVATDLDRVRPETSFETVGPGLDTDSTGTGERRSAGSDAGLREAADITPDRVVFDPNTEQDAEGVLDDRLDDSPRPRGGVDALSFASADEASDIAAQAEDAEDLEPGEVDEAEDDGEALVGEEGLRAPRRAGAPRAAGAGGPRDHPGEGRRERDHGLSGPDPDVPAQTPPQPGDASGGNDEGTNDEGDDVVLVPKRTKG